MTPVVSVETVRRRFQQHARVPETRPPLKATAMGALAIHALCCGPRWSSACIGIACCIAYFVATRVVVLRGLCEAHASLPALRYRTHTTDDNNIFQRHARATWRIRLLLRGSGVEPGRVYARRRRCSMPATALAHELSLLPPCSTRLPLFLVAAYTPVHVASV